MGLIAPNICHLDGSTVKPGMPLIVVEIGAGGAAPAPKAAAPAAAAPAPPPPPPPPAAAAHEAGAIPATPPPAPPTPSEPMASIPVAAIRHAQNIEPAAAPASASGPAPIVRMPPADPTKEIAGTRSEHRVKMNRMRQKIAGRLKEVQPKPLSSRASQIL